LFEHLCRLNPQCNREIMQAVISLAVELAREGREGQRVGALFVVGDEARLLARSKSLILDPLFCHERKLLSIHDPNLRETLKELALLDGAFIISLDGYAVAGCRYLDADASNLDLPMGLGSRHVTAAAVTRAESCTAVVVSESAVVRVFFDGELIAEIVPELWLLSREMTHLRGPVDEREYPGVKIFSSRKVTAPTKE